MLCAELGCGAGVCRGAATPGQWHRGATVELGNLSHGTRGALGSTMPGTSSPAPSRVAGREHGFPSRGIVRECPYPCPCPCLSVTLLAGGQRYHLERAALLQRRPLGRGQRHRAGLQGGHQGAEGRWPHVEDQGAHQAPSCPCWRTVWPHGEVLGAVVLISLCLFRPQNGFAVVRPPGHHADPSTAM